MKPRRSAPTFRRLALVMLVAAAACATMRGEVALQVHGLGWLHDREMRLTLARLMNAGAVNQLDANAIEDGAVILNSAIAEEGFAEPTIEIVATLTDGAERRFQFDPTFARPIPRPLSAKSIAFEVRPGVRWRIAHVDIRGLTVLSPKQGETYFRSSASLFTVASANAYSTSRLSRSETALLDELRRRGYAEATVRAEIESVNHRTGDVSVRVDVAQGSRWRVNQVGISSGIMPGVKLPNLAAWDGHTWTAAVEQDIRESVLLAYYHAGYPDVKITDSVNPGVPRGGLRDVRVSVSVSPGIRVTMGQAQFRGNEVTRDSVLRGRVSEKPGQPLDPVLLEHARYRISRLGVFQSVNLHYEPATGPVRDPVFVLREAPRYETNLLFGYGSYEQFRGGVEYRQRNILGIAHQSRLLLVQSVKSTRGEYTYTVPELFGETIDGSAKLFGLQRKEIAFLRQEYGATLTLRRAVAALHGEATLGYTFEALRNRNNGLLTQATDEKQLNVAHIDLGLTTNRLDNALRPRDGYHATLQAEIASPNFGGVAQYQRVELSGAYHTPWGRGRWIHLGFSHGVITTAGAADDRNLPVNKRFYPGGDNSIRGYRMGEAAPRAPDGRFIGAKSYVLLDAEIEQALTQAWSLVVFGDALGEAATLRDYPYRDKLYSVGLGIRYQTIVGPIRLEYGRNVHRRPHDPGGTLQIAIGFPF